MYVSVMIHAAMQILIERYSNKNVSVVHIYHKPLVYTSSYSLEKK